MARKWTPWQRLYDGDSGYKEMTPRRWLRSRSPGPLVYHLFGGLDCYPWPVRRMGLLFEAACARRGLHLLGDDPAREYFDALVAALDGVADRGPLWRHARDVWGRFCGPGGLYAGGSEGLPPDAEYLLHEEQLPAEAARGHSPREHMRAFVLLIKNHPQVDFDAHYMRAALALGGAGFADELAAQADVARDVFGDPFRPFALAPAWRTETAVLIARGMYAADDYSAMPVLADALQDAGCDDEWVLAHCRGPGPHVRGCRVLEAVLGHEQRARKCRPWSHETDSWG